MEDIEVEVQICDSIFTMRFQNDLPYRGIALEDLDSIKNQAVLASQAVYEYIEKMPVSMYQRGTDAN